MHLTHLKLKNFRGFESFDLDLDRRLTVLVGRNGSGKSSALRAVEIGVSQLVATAFERTQYAIELQASDLRNGESNGEISTTWANERGAPSVMHTLSFELRPEGGIDAANSVDSKPKVPPLCIAFHTNRSRTKADKARGTSARLTLKTQKPAWDDELNADFLAFEHLLHWFKEREDIENQIRVQDENSFGRTDPALDAVRGAVRKVLGGDYGVPRIDRTNGSPRLVLKKREHELSADQLSDGERAQLALAATLARRLYLLDPSADNPLERDALVLIDEIELHLHPAWQRDVLDKLLRTFPGIQLIVSTHSAPILSSVHGEHVRILEGFRAYQPKDPIFGRDANSLLQDVLGVPPRPTEILDQIRTIAALIDSIDKTTDARDQATARLEALESTLGADDAEVIRLRMMLDFLGQSRDNHGPQDDE